MALRYFMWVMKWFFVSVSQRLCGLVSKLLKIKKYIQAFDLLAVALPFSLSVSLS